MKNNQINIQASVIVVNFNNEKYVNRCLNSFTNKIIKFRGNIR